MQDLATEKCLPTWLAATSSTAQGGNNNHLSGSVAWCLPENGAGLERISNVSSSEGCVNVTGSLAKPRRLLRLGG